MKTALGILAGLLLTTSAFAQGQVAFANTASTSYYLWTNNPQGTASNLMSGANAYRIGLYAAQGAGQPAGSLTLAGLATNIAALPGRFSGGNPFAMPAPYVGGDTITFQIKAWSFAGGMDYASAVAAQASNPTGIALAQSPLGTTTLTANPAPPAALWGTSPGQLTSGFCINCVPEPSTWALGILGALAAGLFGRPRKSSRMERSFRIESPRAFCFTAPMKAALGILAGLLLAASAFSQGHVNFSNTASTQFRIWINNYSGTASNLLPGPATMPIRFGLYAAQGAGQPAGSLQLVGLATNIALPGYFSGGNPFFMPAPFAAGDTITFQIRAWSFAGGMSYAEAVAAQSSGTFITIGQSAIGQTVLTANPAPPAPLFGTSPGLVNTGFVLIIPEPSSWALATIGALAATLFCRRRKR